jgi:hypothetical protein
MSPALIGTCISSTDIQFFNDFNTEMLSIAGISQMFMDVFE